MSDIEKISDVNIIIRPPICFCLNINKDYPVDHIKTLLTFIKEFEDHAPVYNSSEGNKTRLTCSTEIITDIPEDLHAEYFSGYGITNLFPFYVKEGYGPFCTDSLYEFRFKNNILSGLIDLKSEDILNLSLDPKYLNYKELCLMIKKITDNDNIEAIEEFGPWSLSINDRMVYGNSKNIPVYERDPSELDKPEVIKTSPGEEFLKFLEK